MISAESVGRFNNRMEAIDILGLEVDAILPLLQAYLCSFCLTFGRSEICVIYRTAIWGVRGAGMFVGFAINLADDLTDVKM